MSNLIIRKLSKKEIESQSINPGQIFMTDDIDKKIFYDNESFSRDDITNFCVYYSNYNTMMTNSDKFQINKLYIDLSTLKFYGLVLDVFKPLETTNEVDLIISNINIFKTGLLQDVDGRLKTVATTVNQILTNKGLTFDEDIDESKILTVVRTKVVRANVIRDNQRTLPIPFPKENFNFENGDKLIVIKDNQEFAPNRYVINSNYMILNKDETPFMKGDLFTYIFYYQMRYDLNSMVQLGTQNYADGSITTEKLSPYLEFSADKIVETQERIFFTNQEKEKLKGIAEGATRYIHPSTHSANMITEEKDRHFVNDEQIKKIQDSCTLKEVYGKKEVDKLISDVVGGAPETLNTLKEICKAFNDDENFATNITKMIEDRALKVDLEKLSLKLDLKTNNRDYVRNGIYQKTSKTNKTGEGDIYNVKVDDPELLQYIDGMLLILKIDETNQKNSFIKINNLDNVPILNPEMELLIQGELKKGCIYHFRFDGTEKNFILQGKGGVELRDTTLKEYTIKEGESILRGNLIDKLPDNTIVKSRPRLLLKSMNSCTEPKYYSNGKVFSFYIDDNKIMAFWIYDKSLRCKVIKVTNDYIDIDNVFYTELCKDCTDFTVVHSNGCFVVSMIVDKTINIKLISNNEYAVVVASSEYIKLEDHDILYLSAIPIDRNKVVISWNVDTNIKTLYISTEINNNIYSINILSNRTNSSYPINKVCKISNRQLIFGTLENNNIILWIMNVEGSDFYLCSKVTFYTDNDNKSLSNLSMYRISDTQVRICWTNSSMLKYYSQIINVSDIGGLKGLDIRERDMTGEKFQTYKVDYQQQLENNFYISVSNYNHLIPTTNNAPGQPCIKVTINKNADMFDIIDNFCNTFNMSTNYHFDIRKNKLIVCYNDKENIGSLNHLYFMIFDIVKTPIGVSLELGQSEQKIKIKEWE